MNGNSMERQGKEEVAMVPKAGWGEKSAGWDDGDSSGQEEGCGVGSCRPGILKRFSTVLLFSIFMGFAHMYVNVLTAFFGTQFIWLERMYGLEPSQLKMLLTWSKIGFLVLVPFLSVFARRWHMPRTLSITTFIVAIAAILCVLPYAIHNSDLHAPPNVTEATQFTLKKLQMRSPSCTSDPSMTAEFMKLMNVGPLDKDCNPIKVTQAPMQKQGKPKEATPKEASLERVRSPVASNDTSVGDEGDEEGGDVAATPRSPAEPEEPRPTEMVPDFTKMSGHPMFEAIKNAAMAQYGIDLEKIAAMSREEQILAMKDQMQSMKAQLPVLKTLLGEDADSYFFPVTIPARRRRRQAEQDPATDQPDASNETTVVVPPPKSDAVETKKQEVEDEKSPKELMLEKLMVDVNWNGRLGIMKRTTLAETFQDPCTIKMIKDMIQQMCPYNTGPLMEDRDNAATTFVALVSLGMLVAGLAKAAHPAFSAIYVDSRSPETKAGLYFGILFAQSALGSLVAEILGFNASTMYITLEDVGLMSFLNPHWLGAWWTGLVVVIVGCVVFSVILFFYPNPNDRLTRQAKGKGLTKTAKGFLQSGMRLLGNPIFLLITIANALTVMACEGMLAYLPKYVENVFYKPPMGEGILLGIVVALVMVIGIFGGGVISTVAKLSPFNCLKVVTGCALVAFVLQAALLGIGCDQLKPEMGGGMVNDTMGQSMQCSETCVCMDFLYMPACGSDGVTYFSPCYAGCGLPLENGDSFEWHHCKCVGDDVQTATPGVCTMDCQGGMFYGFCFLMALACFLVAVKTVPAFLAMFRSVEKQDAPLAIGLNAFIVTLVGAIPSMMIYESLFDGICVQERPACGPIDTCAIYDSETLRMRYNGVGTGLRAAAALFYVIAMVLGFRKSSVYSMNIHEDARKK